MCFYGFILPRVDCFILIGIWRNAHKVNRVQNPVGSALAGMALAPAILVDINALSTVSSELGDDEVSLGSERHSVNADAIFHRSDQMLYDGSRLIKLTDDPV